MDSLRNILLAGLGALGYTQDKMKQMVQVLIERGELTRHQGEELLSEWKSRGKQDGEKIASWVSQKTTSLLENSPVVTREEFLTLEKRVAALEAQKQ